MPRGYEIALDPVSAAVILGVAVVVGLLIGMMPVVRLWRLNINNALREEGRGGTGGRSTNLLRRGLATAQVTIAFVLLIGAGLLLASFRNVLQIDPGFKRVGRGHRRRHAAGRRVQGRRGRPVRRTVADIRARAARRGERRRDDRRCRWPAITATA